MKINKRIAVSGLTIAGVLTAVVGITFAAFTSDATLTPNTLSTGTVNLQIASSDGVTCGTPGATTAGVSSTNLTPGQSDTVKFCLKNDDTNASTTLSVNAAVTPGTGTLTTSLVDISIECGVGPVTGTEASFPGTAIKNLTAGEEVQCTLTQKLDSAATNADQNKTASYDITFTGSSI